MIPSKARNLSIPVLALLLASAMPVFGQERIPFITYGPDAPTREGDNDYIQVIFIRVPSSVTDTLYLRVFDADVGGSEDLLAGDPNTTTRFTLFGGEGAWTADAVTDPIPDFETVQAAGVELFKSETGSDPASDGVWRVLSSIDPAAGEGVGDARYFRLVVNGVSGDDGNVYDIALSGRPDRNEALPGIELVSFGPTIHHALPGLIAEAEFQLPSEAAEIQVHSFDAAGASLRLETRFSSTFLPSSGQDEWRTANVSVDPEQDGVEAALALGYDGNETPNDISFYVTHGTEPLAILLPVRARRTNNRPVPSLRGEPLADCYSVAFDAAGTNDADGDPMTFAWEFGDGGSMDGRAVVHRYEEVGIYTATLSVIDGSGRVGNGTRRELSVVVNDPPVARAGSDVHVARGETVTFDASASTDSDGTITRYLWDFNDGTEGSGRVATHAFQQPGRYLVTMRVQDDSGHPCNSGTDQVEVVVNARPVAEAGENIVARIDEEVVLDGSRSYDTDGSITTFAWDLGDGNSASDSTVVHAYKEAGTYSVVLTVQDDANLDNSTSTDEIVVVVVDPPIAQAGEDRLIAIGEVTVFDGTESYDRDGRIIAYEWDFGDGNRGSDAVVSYAYREPGTYRVRLTVRDNSGYRASSGVDAVMVTVNAPPKASAGQDQHVSTSEVHFNAGDSSDPDGQIASYEWDFGDGSSGTGRNPVHVYSTPGLYIARLVVRDNSGAIRSESEDQVVIRVNARPVADAGPDQSGIVDQVFEFDGGASVDPDGEIMTYEWQFGDGTNTSGQVVGHAYGKPGSYVVRLTVRDNTGHENAVAYDEAHVTVNAPPVADAGPDVLAEPGKPVTFNSSGSYDIDGTLTSYTWDFSDRDQPLVGSQVTRSFEQPGVYSAVLTVTDNSGSTTGTATDRVAIRVNHAPISVPGADVFTCERTITFDGSQSSDPDRDALTFSWDFGDGSPPKGGRIVSHTFRDGGTYPVVLTVDDGTGSSNARDVAAMAVEINRAPIADAGEDMLVCASDRVLFDGSGSSDPEGSVLKYEWDMGDSTFAEGINPTKVFKGDRVYPVRLTVKDDSGLDCGVDKDQVSVKVIQSPVAAAGPDQTACSDTEVVFDGYRSVDIDGVVNRFIWDFGDGETGAGERATHVFAEPGSYEVSLTIEGDEVGECSNTDSDEVTVVVIEAPHAVIDAAPEVAIGASVSFDGSGSTSPASAIQSWKWDFGDGNTAEGETVEHTYTRAGKYVVSLEIDTGDEDMVCASVVDVKSIVVNERPIARTEGPAVVGVNDVAVFDASKSYDPDGTVTSFSWNFGDGVTDDGIRVQHQYDEPGTYEVIVEATDATSAPNSRSLDTLVVRVNAGPEITQSMPETVCTAENVVFDASESRDADGDSLAFSWILGDGNEATGPRVSHTYSEPGRYSVTVVADDQTATSNGTLERASTIHVNSPPVAEAGPDRVVCPNEEVRFDGTSSYDIDLTSLSYEWSFGDGSVSADSVAVHAFSDPGLYAATLVVSDPTGTNCGQVADTAFVLVNGSPTVSAGGDRQAYLGGAYDAVLFDASPSTDPDGDALAFTWDFGDGAGAKGARVSHTYLQPGDYSVVVEASDSTGLTCGVARTEFTVSVRERP